MKIRNYHKEARANTTAKNKQKHNTKRNENKHKHKETRANKTTKNKQKTQHKQK